MLSPKPEDFTRLLEVFREGLERGIVSREDVVGWSDDIIMQTKEPGYFLSRCRKRHACGPHAS